MSSIEPIRDRTAAGPAEQASAGPAGQAGAGPAEHAAALLRTDPHAGFAALREAGPVHRIAGPDGLPVWLVTRYADVRQALADPRLALDRRHALPGNYRGFSLPPALDANLLNMDPPDHTRIRRLVSQTFTAKRIERLRPRVERIADRLLDAIEPLGRADLLAAYAAPLPITVICDLLGVPVDDRPDFRSWTDSLVAPDPSRPQDAKAAVVALLDFLTALVARKRAEPGDDLLSALIAVRDEDAATTATGEDRLSEDELTSLAFVILFAGYENTVHLIGNAVLALLQHPEQLAALRADPTRIGAAVEEFARFDGPAPLAIRRFPREDVEIGGVRVPAGETVMLAIAAANRDPARFAAPDRLELDRPDNAHLALGHGIHYCLGAPLARMETEVALTALLTRFPALALDEAAGAVRHRPSIRARGVLALPVRF
ncbi:cytochrome P450 [Kitasatospora sp. RB6PN24]|uniref:cytochrome P450 family protein n=1 Tax=Kitasatospora humi TaxID=2893891 RepID=UPI001E4DB5A6|nr:cytochrome P450 [Kitasatospora humi]MCC9305702.1 cytochrome P450 [Kitasatospora humi]